MSDPVLTPSRRQTIAWFAAAVASPVLTAMRATSLPGGAGWPALTLTRIAAPGYGADPKLSEKKVTWPLTLTPDQRAILRQCADLILPPAPGKQPPSKLGIDAFVDEWISAPYAQQASDRALIVPGLLWLDDEARRRSSQPFLRAGVTQQRAIFDAIAWRDRVAPDLAQAGRFFASLRTVIVLGYYTLPEGEEELGFVGNTPIEGVYPGPDAAPLKHLREQLARLGLAMPKSA